MKVVRLTISVPPAGKSPSEFRRNFKKAIRDAAARLQLDGELGAELVEEIFRALPIEEPRQ